MNLSWPAGLWLSWVNSTNAASPPFLAAVQAWPDKQQTQLVSTEDALLAGKAGELPSAPYMLAGERLELNKAGSLQRASEKTARKEGKGKNRARKKECNHLFYGKRCQTVMLVSAEALSANGCQGNCCAKPQHLCIFSIDNC